MRLGQKLKISIFFFMHFHVLMTYCQPITVTKKIDGNVWKGTIKNNKPTGKWVIINHENIIVNEVIYKKNNIAVVKTINSRGGIYSILYCRIDPGDSFHLTANGPDTNFYDNGAIRTIGFFKNGKAEGTDFYFSESGDTLAIDHFKYGKRNGESKEFYEQNKSLKTSGYYLNDDKTGNWTEFYLNGKIKSNGEFYPKSELIEYSDTNYKLIKDSLKRSFLDTTQIPFPHRRFFKNKQWSYWTENGKLFLQEFWENGKLINAKKYN